MPAAKRAGHEGRRVVWPWSDRGRSKVTAKKVRDDIEALRRMLEPRWFEVVRL